MPTEVPPPVGPAVGLAAVTVGAATRVKWSDEDVALVPPAVVTVTSTVPADPEGAVALIEVDELTVKLLAAAVPKVTAVAFVKFVPVMLTVVPPAVGPDVGLMPLTVGAAAKTY